MPLFGFADLNHHLCGRIMISSIQYPTTFVDYPKASELEDCLTNMAAEVSDPTHTQFA